MVADQIALTEALGGGEDALLVAHDWGAVGAWGALGRAPHLWGRAVIINIPPFDIFGENLGTWSPGYVTDEDMVHIREVLQDPDHLRAALGYYWAQFDPTRFGSPEWAAEQEAAWGGSAPQPVLYLHGTTDGCHGVRREQVERVRSYTGPGSDSELIEGVGHFMLVERPQQINDRITGWLSTTG